MKREKDYRLGVGASSILMILIALFLSTFAVLSLASAKTDEKQTDRAIESTRNYYFAELETEKIYAKIDAVLQSDGVNGLNEAYIEGVTLYFSTDQIVFAVDIDSEKVLESTLRIVADDYGRKTFEVLARKTVLVEEWNPKNSLNVWKGE